MSRSDAGCVLTRRQLLAASAALGMGAAGAPAVAVPPARNFGASTAPGRYPALDLDRDTVRIAVAQTRIGQVSSRNPRADRLVNVAHMCEWVDRAFATGRSADLLVFHAWALMPSAARRSRDQLLRMAMELPGEECDRLAAKAREYGCHIAFSAWQRDVEWPGQVLAVNVLLDEQGDRIATQWQACHERRPGAEHLDVQLTTVEDVLEAYVERYGVKAVLPVACTRVGNIALHAVAREPELVRALAAKGCEVLVRSAPGGYTRTDMAAGSLYSGIYTVVAGRAWPGSGGLVDATVSDWRSQVIGPRGETLNQADCGAEQVLITRIPLRAYRERHATAQPASRLLNSLG